jgi:hypothetical protein
MNATHSELSQGHTSNIFCSYYLRSTPLEFIEPYFVFCAGEAAPFTRAAAMAFQNETLRINIPNVLFFDTKSRDSSLCQPADPPFTQHRPRVDAIAAADDAAAAAALPCGQCFLGPMEWMGDLEVKPHLQAVDSHSTRT